MGCPSRLAGHRSIRSFDVGTGRAGAADGLLANDRAGWLVVDRVVACLVAQRGVLVGDGLFRRSRRRLRRGRSRWSCPRVAACPPSPNRYQVRKSQDAFRQPSKPRVLDSGRDGDRGRRAPNHNPTSLSSLGVMAPAQLFTLPNAENATTVHLVADDAEEVRPRAFGPRSRRLLDLSCSSWSSLSEVPAPRTRTLQPASRKSSTSSTSKATLWSTALRATTPKATVRTRCRPPKT